MTTLLTKVRSLDIKQVGVDPWPVVIGWVLTAMAAAAVPWAHWNRKRQQYYKYAGYLAEYQNQQRQYEEANNGQNQYYAANSNCKWWKWGCNSSNNYYNGGNNNQYQNNQNNQNNNYQQNQQNQQNGNGYRFPNWFFMLGGSTEEDRRQREEEMGSSNPSAVRLIHAWTNLLFAGLVIYGAVSLARGNNLNSVRTAFFIFMQFAIMMMIVMPQAIETDDREMEDSVYGWYGQLTVLMVYQDFWYSIYSLGACIFLTCRMVWIQRQAKAAVATETTYKTMDEGTDIA